MATTVADELLKERTYERLRPEEAKVFSSWLRTLNGIGVPYAIGGAFALYAHTGLWRDTKDLDVFVRPRDVRRVLAAFGGEDRTLIHDVHWLAKVLRGDHLLDVLFAVSNENVPIDDGWFEHARPVRVVDVPTRVIAAEELLASKAFVVRHDRFDGADIVHVIHNDRGRLDWDRVLERMAGDLDLLYWYFVLYLYAYPDRGEDLPRGLFTAMHERASAAVRREGVRSPGAFRGTLIDPDSFRPDVEEWGYADPRRSREHVDPEGREI